MAWKSKAKQFKMCLSDLCRKSKSISLTCPFHNTNYKLGQCHKLDIFLRSNILISTFCVCGDGFQDLKSLSLPHSIINFLFASLKSLTNFENAN